MLMIVGDDIVVWQSGDDRILWDGVEGWMLSWELLQEHEDHSDERMVV
jgi:hypothetical protein